MSRSEILNSALPQPPASVRAELMPHTRAWRTGISLRKSARLALWFGTITMIGYALAQSSLAVLMAYLLFGLTGLAMVRRGGRSAIDLFLLAYGVVCLFSVFLYVVYTQRYGVPYFNGGSDDLSFERYGYYIAQGHLTYDPMWIKSVIHFYSHNSIGYVYILGLLIRLGEFFGGYDTLIPRILNAGILGLTSVLVSRIAVQIGLDKRNAVIAGIWVILFPMMFFSAAHVFRDTITGFILMASLYLSLAISTHRAKVFQASWLVYTALFLLLIPIMKEIRYLYLIPMMAMLLSAWTFKLWPVLRFRLWHTVFIVPALVLFLNLSEELHIIIQGFMIIERYGEGLSAGVRSAEGGLSGILFSLPQPFQTIGRFGYALIVPLPILYADIEWNLLGAGALVQFYLSAFIFLGIKVLYRYAQILPLLLGFGIVFFSYMMGSFTFRHITQWFPFAVLIGLVGYRRYKSYRRRIFVFCTVLLFFLGFIYVYFKGF